ncbi:MAG: hypothetical protein K9K65_03945 [Desulfarculaceae bacterium]|nr:hypothetical protein [Desulfarculaceae bacterium]MCF8046494.1 hypothetical protein [Desulfarculaceae bacterium]MCF8096971.1 hypothetical protein [Desulfarculaceae bacterium]MCF8122665.1 hypothetical protein [Desulfarculaceae bacterium]
MAGPQAIKGPRTQAELAGLLELARMGEDAAPREARRGLAHWCAADPKALGRVLRLLPRVSPQAREWAGLWLFAPEAADELPLRRRLLAGLGGFMDLAARLPEPWLLEGLAELVLSMGGAPLRRLLGLAKEHDWARRVVALLPRDARLPGGSTTEVWLARHRLGQSEVRRISRLARAGRWEALAQEERQSLTLAHAVAGDNPAAAQARPLAWPAGPQALGTLEAMARLTVREGQEAYEVARQASQRLGRVVLLLGNASLGGPPLWAVPGPWQQAVGDDLATGPLPRPPAEAVRRLAWLRAQRLGSGELLSALWQARVACHLAGHGLRLWQKLAQEATPWLKLRDRAGLAQGSLGLSLEGPPWGQALERARTALEHCRGLESQGRAALNLFHGLAARGGAPLALPWADKFAASTAKGGDHLYLVHLTALLAGLDPPPLLLLIDQTTHPGFPSMTQVLARAMVRRPGLVLRGVGSFAGEDEPRDLTKAVLRAAEGAHVVALRPTPGKHPEASLAAHALGQDQGRPLTPASRDGAAQLLAGTALAALADFGAPQGEDEPPPWLLTTQGFAPVGAWLRGRVVALAGCAEPDGRRWRRYRDLANLA